MNWNSAADFFAMGGYGPFVWGSYAVAALCILVEPLLTRQRHRRALADARLQREAAALDGSDRDTSGNIPQDHRP